MILHDSMLVTLIQLIDRIPLPSQPGPRRRGRPLVYSDRLFLQALVIMIVHHLHKVNGLLANGSTIAACTPSCPSVTMRSR